MNTQIKEQSYTIYWESLKTNEIGHGIESCTYKIAKSWVDNCNKRHPYINHYMKEN